jgi:type IV secretion system protein VirB2
MNKVKFFVAALVLGFSMVLSPMQANAAADFGGVGGKLCEVVRAITGNVGRAIATIAVVFLGIGAFFGKVTWGLAVAVSIGIFAIFGAANIVGRFGGGACT